MGRAERKADRDERAILIAWLREGRGWNQIDLAQEAGLDKGQVSDYEQGTKYRPETLEKILNAVNLPQAWADALLPIIRLYRQKMQGREPEGEEDGSTRIFTTMLEVFQALGPALVAGAGIPLEPPAPSVEELRSKAVERFDRMVKRTLAERQVLVDRSPRFRHWTMVERMCEASREAALGSPPDAKAWIDLAFRAIQVAREAEEALPLRLEAYCLGHRGNVHRAANDPEAAQRDFGRAWELWREQGAELRDKTLEVAWLFGLEAALFQEEGKLPESLRLLDRGLELVETEPARAALLAKKAEILKAERWPSN